MSKLHSECYRVAGLVAGLLFSFGVYAADIQIDGAWAFATAPGKDTANVYMYITSKQSALLVGASSPKSKVVELRTMLHKGGMMKTITVPNVELSANTRADMTSEHGYHLTLVGLKSPLKAGKSVPLTLKFEQADKNLVTVDVMAEIRPGRGSR
ncbi:MAG: copper chaperone PCu(A)C [Sideroxydans sp.]|jgi:hypothetical protein